MKRPERSTEQLDPEVERGLEAIDRALAGERPQPAEADLVTLVTDLREARPRPSLTLEQELERLRERGFHRERGGINLGGRRLRPMSLLLPAGALATLAVIAVAVIAVPQGTEDQLSDAGGTVETPAATDVDGLAPGGSSATESAAPPSLQDSRAFEGAPRQAGDAAGGDTNLNRSAGRNALGTEKRLRDRSATVALQTDTGGVREVSDQVIQITENGGGVVVSSELNEGLERSSANLELQVPSRELDATLDRITDLATVKSLNEAAVDITRPFVSAQDKLKDLRAKRKQLLNALGSAETEAEGDALQQQIDSLRSRISRAESRFQNIARRARLSTVAVSVEGIPGGDDDGEWSLGDAADDALSTLKTVAGVMLVGAAIAVPVGLLVAIFIYGGLAIRRRRRESVLDD